MKMIEIKKDINWGFWFRGKPIIVNKKYYGMRCDSVERDYELPSDIELVEMNEDYVRQCDGMGDYKVKYFYEQDRLKNFHGIVALDKGKIVGFICGAKTDLSNWKYKVDDDYFYIKYVYVDPEYRGRHISGCFIKQLYKQGVGTLYLMVRKNNKSAIIAYNKCGFYKIFYRRQVVFPLIKKKYVYYYKRY